ncbi:MAG TPA: hypothetical protein VFX61_02620 [Micromonosporaceae bacterium]|nr:hypothetical protein [Micromonosporaceae bacterium]
MKRLLTPAWLVRHAVAVVLVLAFLGLGWWQVSRAASGNTLSWAYAFEWPVFAVFVVFLWLREVRQTLAEKDGTVANTAEPAPTASESTPPGFRRPVRSTRIVPPPEPAEDTELAAYNRYLTWLNANPDARPGDYPG